jgi:hypothetical protein
MKKYKNMNYELLYIVYSAKYNVHATLSSSLPSPPQKER